jgi:hypothetical protein
MLGMLCFENGVLAVGSRVFLESDRGQDAVRAASPSGEGPELARLKKMLRLLGRSLRGVDSLEQARALLAEVADEAEREFERNARLLRGPSRSGGGDFDFFSGGSAARFESERALRLVRVDGHGPSERDSDWDVEGPYGGSLAWLSEQPRPEGGQRCDRCNWRGRVSWMVGREPRHARDLRLLVRRSHARAVLGRRPLLAEYARPLALEDMPKELRIDSCFLCLGPGFVEGEQLGPKLTPRPQWSFEDAGEGEDVGTGDRHGPYGRMGEDDGRPAGLDLDGVAAGADATVFDAEGESGHGSLFEEDRAAWEVLVASVDYLGTGLLGGESRRRAEIRGLLESRHRKASACDDLTYLRKLIPGGGGRQRAGTRAAFEGRDAWLMMLILLGYEVEDLARATEISRKQLDKLPLVRSMRAAANQLQLALVHRWRRSGHELESIARACGVSVKTIRRRLREPLPSPADPDAALFFSTVRGGGGDHSDEWHDWVLLALFNRAAPGGDPDQQFRSPFVGFPFTGEPPYLGLGGGAGAPYHTWIARTEDCDQRAVSESSRGQIERGLLTPVAFPALRDAAQGCGIASAA